MIRLLRLVPPILSCLAPLLWTGANDSFAMNLSGGEAERLLATAEIVGSEKIDMGITRPQRISLADGDVHLQAVWKTVEIYRPRQPMGNGRVQLGFRDSYRSEVAAYRLSKVLGLDIVPPTVEREIDFERGSLQLWLPGCVTETERRKQWLHPPDMEAWNRQMVTVRLFHQLIHDTDFNNINNILISEDFRIWVIDSSRGFYLDRELRNEDALERFSESLLKRLRALDKNFLKNELGEWLSGKQIEALLHRRDRILDLADRRVANLGAEAVLFP